MSDHQKKYLMLYINKYRNAIASGVYKTNGNTAATDMWAVSYDKKLEYTIQCCTNFCESKFCCTRTTDYKSVGQVFYYLKNTHTIDISNIEKAIDGIFLEIYNTNDDNVGSYSEKGKNGTVNNVSQLLYSKSTINI